MKLEPVKQFALEVIQLQKGLANDPSNLSIMKQIAGKYFQMGNKESGFLYLDKTLKLDREIRRPWRCRRNIKGTERRCLILSIPDRTDRRNVRIENEQAFATVKHILLILSNIEN